MNNTCGESNSEWLHCNGYICFTTSSGAHTEAAASAINIEEAVVVSPNPASDCVTILVREPLQDSEGRFVDAAGKVLLQSQGAGGR